MTRPTVDIVVPFAGERNALDRLCTRLRRLELAPGDTIVVVDNTPRPKTGGQPPGEPMVVVASERSTPGYARNRGAERGGAEWLVFLDADTEPPADLLERYFDPPPTSETGLLAGGVIDEPVAPRTSAPARYAYLRGTLNQNRTLEMGRWSFAQTANVACRRSAFEALGGFREDIRAGEDADLSYRMKERGWRLERRDQAAVVHLSRRTLGGFIAQAALHGAGSAWVERNYPGAFPSRRRLGLTWWAVRTAVRGVIDAVRFRDRDRLIHGSYEPLWELCFEFGRSLSVEDRLRRPGSMRSRADNLRPR